MALIECPDCGKQVSDAAATCIGCGRPLRGVAASPAPAGTREAPMLIEASSKKYKSAMLLGLACLPAGFIVAMLGGAAHSGLFAAFGFLIMIIGVVWFFINLVARWYHHA